MSDINMTLFTVLNPQKFAAERKFFIDKNAGDIKARFATYVANCVAHTLTHSEPKHINSALAASRNIGQYRMTKRILQGLIPFDYDKDAEAFGGKMNKDKAAKLREEITDDKTGETAMRWEFLLRQKLFAEDSAEKAASKADWDLQAAVIRLVKQAEKNGCTKHDIEAALHKAA